MSGVPVNETTRGKKPPYLPASRRVADHGRPIRLDLRQADDFFVGRAYVAIIEGLSSVTNVLPFNFRVYDDSKIAGLEKFVSLWRADAGNRVALTIFELVLTALSSETDWDERAGAWYWTGAR